LTVTAGATRVRRAPARIASRIARTVAESLITTIDHKEPT
jgi:hypothetical protein